MAASPIAQAAAAACVSPPEPHPGPRVLPRGAAPRAGFPRRALWALTEKNEGFIIITPRPRQPGILQFFAFGHLPPHLQVISKSLADVAQRLNAELPDGAEKSAGLRKLLEAKDCFVRAAMPEPPPAEELPGFDPSRVLGYSEGRLVWFDKSP